MPQAMIFTSTCAGPGLGIGNVTSCKGMPGFSNTMARIVEGPITCAVGSVDVELIRFSIEIAGGEGILITNLCGGH